MHQRARVLPVAGSQSSAILAHARTLGKTIGRGWLRFGDPRLTHSEALLLESRPSIGDWSDKAGRAAHLAGLYAAQAVIVERTLIRPTPDRWPPDVSPALSRQMRG
jgi:hypothetical protein